MKHRNTPLPDEAVIKELCEMLRENIDPSIRKWGKRFGHARSTMTVERFDALVEDAKGVAEFEVPKQPDEIAPIEDILERRRKEFDRRKTAEDAARLIDVQVRIDGPYAICHMGDPHLDDPGTDIAGIEHDLKVIRATRGMFAANVGDVTNNWVGRLAKLYGQQGTTEAEAWRLAEWFFGQSEWLYCVRGNHDLWSGDGSPLNWIMRGRNCAMSKSQVRIRLLPPAGQSVIVNARHDFQGHSMWNVVHALAKAGKLSFRDDILVCGHKHTSGYAWIVDPESRRLLHCIRVEGYKIYDDYATTNGFIDHRVSPYAVTVVDPQADNPARLIQAFWDLELAADYLTWLRRNRAA